MKLLSISNLRRFTKHLKNTKNRSHTTGQLLKSAKLTVSTGGNGINTSLRTYSLPPVRPIQDYAKSVLEIAEHEMKLPNGNLTLATDYLELVASSNAEHVTRAAELLKEVKSKIQEHETEQAWKVLTLFSFRNVTFKTCQWRSSAAITYYPYPSKSLTKTLGVSLTPAHH